MENATPVPISELEALRLHTEGVNMPPAALVAIHNLNARIPDPQLEAAIDDFQKALQEISQIPPEKHLCHILSRIALISFDKHDVLYLFQIALHAAQWAYLCNGDRSPYTDIPEDARMRYSVEAPTVFDLAVRTGDAARAAKLGWDPYYSLIELAGRALAWSAKQAGDSE